MGPFLTGLFFLHLLLPVYAVQLAHNLFDRNYSNNEHLSEINQFPKNGGTAAVNLTDKTQRPIPKGVNPQFVLLSFDGSKNLQMWEQTTKFAKEMTKSGKPLHFTYFISGVYFLPKNKALLYHPPSFPPGTSRIGFSDTVAEIPLRVEEVKNAQDGGNEIGSHLNGHFAAGALWGKEGWTSEISQFKSLLENVGTNIEQPEIKLPNLEKITGIRSPNLSKNPSLYESLEEAGFVYDSSFVGKPQDMPYKIGNIWEIPLKDIPLWGTKQTVISMDYNFWSRQSNATDVTKKGTPLYSKFHDQMLKSYQDYFNSVYTGSRAPVVIGHHFSLWNDGVYWEALKDFAGGVCGKPDVYCTTFTGYVNYLNSTSHK